MNLYTLSSEYQALLDRLQCADEISEEDMALLLDVQDDLDKKMDSYGIVINTLMAQKAQLQIEKKRLSDWEDSISSNIAQMKNALTNAMTLNGIDSKQTEHFRFSFRKSTSVQVADNFIAWALQYGKDYFLKRADPTPDKTAIKKALEDGQEMPAYIVESNNLQIK